MSPAAAKVRVVVVTYKRSATKSILDKRMINSFSFAGPLSVTTVQQSTSFKCVTALVVKYEKVCQK